MKNIFDYLAWRDRLASAIDTRLYSIEYLDRLVVRNRAKCWVGKRSAMLTGMRKAPSGATVIHGLIAAGEMDEIRNDLIPRAEEWARGQGCRYAIIESRAGWARALRAQGYETHQVTLRKEL